MRQRRRRGWNSPEKEGIGPITIRGEEEEGVLEREGGKRARREKSRISRDATSLYCRQRREGARRSPTPEHRKEEANALIKKSLPLRGKKK